MTNQYRAPKYDAPAFTCPHCGAFAGVKWEELFSKECESLLLERAICDACKDYSLWDIETDGNGLERNGRLIYPNKQTAPLPNEYLSKDCKKDYMEAREIQFNSPRGAAALLRLCIHKLCVELGEKGNRLYDDIGNLIAKGIPTLAGKSLDVVRIFANDAVHPGELSVDDNPEVVDHLFVLVNIIADSLIATPNLVEGLYKQIPDTKKRSA